MSLSRVLCIVGPTGSGKSQLSELVTMELGGEVVSIDAMQVYRGMDIGTAKTPRALRRCPLHMVDVVDMGTPYSVSLFQRDARACIDGLVSRGKVPVLCGGTGLYLDAVIDEMSFPKGDQMGDARRRYEEYAQKHGTQALHDLLAQRDSQSANLIHPNNQRRVIRALEMLDEGTSYAKHHEGLKRRAPHYAARLWGIEHSRERLYERIDARVDDMFANGLVSEVEQLAAHGLRESTTASQAIGYKEVLLALDGTISMDEARNLVKRNTRRYAKRQLSWLKRDGRVSWLRADEHTTQQMVARICDDWRTP
ncbi:MAG: tRNA (adenosine(37)-N6)-dimethylallyltransferase MiaA [Coriobacteriales bacterium]|nr:tRNA (adenosine(37)-N6)-dimethylallyltransferase MiaA [Coriobacteriales bacterium]